MADTLTTNLASKFDPKVVESWNSKSLAAKVTNQNYKFTGVKEVTVWSLPTTPLVDFNRTAASNRYGTPTNLNDITQTMSVSQDKAFTKIIEAGDNAQQMNIKGAAKYMNMQTNKVIIPHLDTYTFAIMAAKAGKSVSAALSSNNAYEKFLDGLIELGEYNVPSSDIVCIMSPTFYKAIHLDTSFILNSDVAMKSRENGWKGTIEGIPCYLANTSVIPSGMGFMLATPDSTVACQQLKEVNILPKVQGYSGPVMEFRMIHDAFVLDELVHGIYVHWHSGTLVAAPTATYTAATTDTIVLASATEGATIYYTTDGSDPRRNADKLTYSTAIDTSAMDAGYKVVIKAYAVKAGSLDSNLLETTVTIEA